MTEMDHCESLARCDRLASRVQYTWAKACRLVSWSWLVARKQSVSECREAKCFRMQLRGESCAWRLADWLVCRWAVQVLGTGELSKPLTIHAAAFSEGAKEKIAAAGGNIVEIPQKAKWTRKAHERKVAAAAAAAEASK
jgi:Ribosomal proteins 50S-L15, 50S-L18e, 60S-L27A